MAVSANGVLRVMLEHPEIFFKMMDYAEETIGLGSEEFSLSYYNYVLGAALEKLPGVARSRVAEALQVSNLDHAGLLDYEDEKRDRFLLKPFVIEMMRHLDRSRLKELSDSDLENLRIQLQHALDSLKAPGLHWDDADPTFRETMSTALTTVRNVVSRIKQNVEALRGQSIKLAQLADDADGQSRSLQLSNTLERIYQINTRHIEPTLIFLNPAIDWKGANNSAPMQIMKSIVSALRERQRHEEFATVNRAFLNVLGYADIVSTTRRGLDTYLQLYDKQRKIYNTIEERYNDLLERARELHDGKTRYRLKVSDAHFAKARVFSGLKDYRSAGGARINWPAHEVRLAYEEFKRVLLDRYSLTQGSGVETVTENSGEDGSAARSKRMDDIAQVASTISLEDELDIFDQIHQVLIRELPGYSIPELIDAVYFTPGAKHTTLLNRRRRLSHGNQEFHYFERHVANRGEGA